MGYPGPSLGQPGSSIIEKSSKLTGFTASHEALQRVCAVPGGLDIAPTDSADDTFKRGDSNMAQKGLRVKEIILGCFLTCDKAAWRLDIASGLWRKTSLAKIKTA